MYPPLDDTSNNIGGKGSSEQQDTLVGKKWEGSDVPASIIEAGRLFSSHVKMTRAIRQLWEERERFMTFERGWNADEKAGNPEIGDDAGSSTGSSLEEPQKNDQCRAKETDDDDVQRRLDAVELFYVSIKPLSITNTLLTDRRKKRCLTFSLLSSFY